MRPLIPIAAIALALTVASTSGAPPPTATPIAPWKLQPRRAAEPRLTSGHAGALMIRYARGQSPTLLRARAAAAGLRVIRVIPQIAFEEAVPLRPDARAAHAARAPQPAGAIAAEADTTSRLAHGPCTLDPTCLIPNDPGFIDDWALQSDSSTAFPPHGKPHLGADIDAPRAWRQTQGSPRVVIAIIDTGIDVGHPDLAGKVVLGTTIAGTSALDHAGHGTAVAGIAAAKPDNRVGITGAGWASSLMDVKVTDDTNDSSDLVIACGALAQGVVFAADHGAQVINVSADSASPCAAEQAAIDYATAKGSLIVAAAGNEGSASPHYPAAYPNVVSVAATDDADQRARFSNFGSSWVELAAPGVQVTATLPHYPNATGLENYGFVDGTSYAAAYVSGIAALLWPITTDTNGDGRINDEVAQRIFNFADPIPGTGRLWRFGRLNACRAVAARAAACPAQSGTSLVIRPNGRRQPAGSAKPVPGLKSRRVLVGTLAGARSHANHVLQADYAPELKGARGFHDSCLRKGLDRFTCSATWRQAGAHYRATVSLRYEVRNVLRWHNTVPKAYLCRHGCRSVPRTRSPAPVSVGG